MRVVNPGPSYAEGAAGFISKIVNQIEPGRRINVGLAGGGTPKPVYEALRLEQLTWENTDLWLSDERWVPPDHPDSNGRMVAETLASHIPAMFHRPRWSERMTAADSAAFYEATIRTFIHDLHPDVVLLGIGTDGHIASLFPSSQALKEPSPRLIVANEVPALANVRLTVTPRLLELTSHIVVLVAGESKGSVLAEVVENKNMRLPASLLLNLDTDVTWLVDEAALRGLKATEVERL